MVPKFAYFRRNPEVKGATHERAKSGNTENRMRVPQGGQADKKAEGFILEQYVKLSGDNRKPAIRGLSKPPAKTAMVVITGKPLFSKREKSPTRKTG
jgi:hypothetical protein